MEQEEGQAHQYCKKQKNESAMHSAQNKLLCERKLEESIPKRAMKNINRKGILPATEK